MLCQLTAIDPHSINRITLQNPNACRDKHGLYFDVFYFVEMPENPTPLTDKLAYLAETEEDLWSLIYIDFDPVIGVINFQNYEIVCTSVSHSHIYRDVMTDCCGGMEDC